MYSNDSSAAKCPAAGRFNAFRSSGQDAAPQLAMSGRTVAEIQNNTSRRLLIDLILSRLGGMKDQVFGGRSISRVTPASALSGAPAPSPALMSSIAARTFTA